MDTPKLTQIVKSATKQQSDNINRKRQLGMEALRLAQIFSSKKLSKEQQLKIAKSIAKTLLAVDYRNFDKLNDRNKVIAMRLAEDITSPNSWNPTNANDSYTKVDLSTSAGKGVKQNTYSQVNYNDCMSRKKLAGYPTDAAAVECAGELRFRNTAIAGNAYHTDSTQDSVNSMSATSRTTNNFINPSSTTQYFGRRKTSLERAKEALQRASELETDIKRNKSAIIHSGSLSQSLNRESYFSKDKPQIKSSAVESEISDIPAWYRTRAGTMRELVPSKSSIKSGSNKSRDLSWLVTRQFLLDGNYRDQVVTPQLEKENKRILSASRYSTPAFIKIRNHVTSHVGGM